MPTTLRIVNKLVKDLSHNMMQKILEIWYSIIGPVCLPGPEFEEPSGAERCKRDHRLIDGSNAEGSDGPDDAGLDDSLIATQTEKNIMVHNKDSVGHLPWDQVKVQLTPWGRDKMTAIFQMTFSNVCSWMKTFEFQMKFHWNVLHRL